jgi:uncharacterized SAM-binding protein YcdF (DUF218 family)
MTEPLGIIWIFTLVVLCWLLVRRQWRCSGYLGLPIILIFLVGSTPFVDVLVGRVELAVVATSRAGRKERNNWETRPGGRELQARTAVLILGGGYYESDNDPYGFALRDAGTRLLAGVDLARSVRASALVLGGAPPSPGRPGVVGSALVENWIEAWGLAKTFETVTNLGICMNTHDEAAQFQKLQKQYGWRRVYLVTSALHMPRSLALFRKLGIDVEPVPCDFKVYGVAGPQFRFLFFPSLTRFQIFGLYLHETIGWWVYRWRGWI